eukprot:COSAG01_NODE_24585_length_773_cov_84.762611_1_plen_88_part_10
MVHGGFAQLKFARQTGVPIVALMCENPDSWTAGGWLGILTAGALWTPMWSDAQASDENVQAIITQIRYAVQGGGGGGGGGSGDDGGND